MSQFKKLFCSIFAIVILMSFSSCGNDSVNQSYSDEISFSGSKKIVKHKKKKPTKPKKVTDVNLTVWSSSKDNSWVAQMEEKFQKIHPEYKITFKNSVVESQDPALKMNNNSESPDVFCYCNDMMIELLKLGKLGELPPYAVKQVKKQNDDVVVRGVTYTDGKLYGVPYTTNSWLMYYNKSKFTPDDVKSLDKMIAKGKVAFDISNAWYLAGFYSDGAVSFFGKNENDASKGIKFNKKAVAITQYIIDLTRNSNFVLGGNGRELKSLRKGSVDAIFSGTWSASEVKKILGSNYAATSLPKFKTKIGEFQMKAFSGSRDFGFNPNSSYKKAAAKFAAFLGSKNSQKVSFEKTGTVPSDKRLSKFVGKADAAAEAEMKVIARTSILQPTIPEMYAFWDPMQKFGKTIAKGEASYDDADKLIDDLNQGLQLYHSDR